MSIANNSATRRFPVVGALLLLALTFAVSIMDGQQHRRTSRNPVRWTGIVASSTAQAVRTREARPSLPLTFEMNQGQVDGRVKFLARTPNYTLFLTTQEAVFVLSSGYGGGKVAVPPAYNSGSPKETHGVSILRLGPLGGSRAPRVSGSRELTGTVNYLIGRVPTKWHTNVPTYAGVTYHNVYPGVDLVYHGKSGHLENDIIVSPGADPTKILMHFEGAEKITLGSAGDLLICTKSGNLSLRRPYAYQGRRDDPKVVRAAYVLRAGGTVAIDIAQFDRGRTLVVDPEITYSPGGQESEEIRIPAGFDSADQIATEVAQFIDSSGNVWVAGNVDEVNFPTTSGAYLTTYPAGSTQTGVITKLNPTLSSVLYSTYFGASASGGTVTMGGPYVDSSGNVYVAGSTNETNFPTTAGAYLTTYPSGSTSVGFISKLNSSLSTLTYSTFLGASVSGGTVTFGGFKVDSSGNFYVAGATNEHNFPTTSGAYLTTYPAGSTSAGFVAKLNSTLSTLTYSTFLGASVSGGIVTVGGPYQDSSGNLWVGGATNETGFPTTSGAYQTTYPSSSQAGFITKFNSTLSAISYSTFLGGVFGSGTVTLRGPVMDSSGDVVVAGNTNETTFPTTSGAYQSSFPSSSQAGFIAKLNSTLSTLSYSTFLGGSFGLGTVAAGGFSVDSSGNVFLSGTTNETTFPTTSGAYLTTYPGGNSQVAFVSKLNSTLGSLTYSTFLGATFISGSGTVTIGGPALDSSGYVYVVGATNVSSFPTTAGAYQTTYPTSYQAGFITRLNPSLSALSYSTFLGGTNGTVVIH